MLISIEDILSESDTWINVKAERRILLMEQVIKLEEKLEDITGVTCIYIPVKDVYESIKWYQKNLGCEPTHHNPVKPGMELSILRFPDHNGDFFEPGLRQTVPAIFLMKTKQAAGSLDFALDSSVHIPLACFITPRIQEIYDRFKENGVNIVSDISENKPSGPNFKFCDPDGNMLEMWQP